MPFIVHDDQFFMVIYFVMTIYFFVMTDFKPMMFKNALTTNGLPTIFRELVILKNTCLK